MSGAASTRHRRPGMAITTMTLVFASCFLRHSASNGDGPERIVAAGSPTPAVDAVHDADEILRVPTNDARRSRTPKLWL